MPSTIRDLAFGEPAGRVYGTVQLCGALAFAGLYVYARSAGSGSGSSWLLFMVAGAALAGVAESLPTDLRRVAGVLRIAAVVTLVGLLIAVLFLPGYPV
ncbi:hypothetical protein [Halobaculum lipolyticum]|uniref:Uncharacterized protein n=1 Tax=Halobaculum lipolyticum TaxID=3032001 RepID=A0ABD5WDH4_9EURY|nr:hypothetical protein [Halobaculum sp. DT31]